MISRRIIGIGFLFGMLAGASVAWADAPLRIGLVAPGDEALAVALAAALRARLQGADVAVAPPEGPLWPIRVDVTPTAAGREWDVRVSSGAGVGVTRHLSLGDAPARESQARALAVVVAELLEAVRSDEDVSTRPPARGPEAETLARRRPPAEAPDDGGALGWSVGLAAAATGSLDAGSAARATAGGLTARAAVGRDEGPVGILRLGWAHFSGARSVDVDLIPLAVGVGWRLPVGQRWAFTPDAHFSADAWVGRGLRQAGGVVPGGGLGVGIDFRALSWVSLFIDARVGVAAWPVEMNSDDVRAFELRRVRWSVGLGTELAAW